MIYLKDLLSLEGLVAGLGGLIAGISIFIILYFNNITFIYSLQYILYAVIIGNVIGGLYHKQVERID